MVCGDECKPHFRNRTRDCTDRGCYSCGRLYLRRRSLVRRLLWRPKVASDRKVDYRTQYSSPLRTSPFYEIKFPKAQPRHRHSFRSIIRNDFSPRLVSLELGARGIDRLHHTNEIHCWTHRSPRENGKIITFLQRAKILQSPRGHAVHHTDPKDRSYCTVTDWLNPLLDRFDFFARLERFVLQTTGLKRRVDESVKPPKQKKKKVCCGQCLGCGKCDLKKAA